MKHYQELSGCQPRWLRPRGRLDIDVDTWREHVVMWVFRHLFFINLTDITSVNFIVFAPLVSTEPHVTADSGAVCFVLFLFIVTASSIVSNIIKSQ